MSVSAELERILGIKLTTLREMIYNILARANCAMSAYEILEALKRHHPKANAMTIYRTLEYFQQQGLVHRLENGNKYIVCDNLHQPCSGVVQCVECGSHCELHDAQLNDRIAALLLKLGFTYKTGELEIKGRCIHCQAHEAK